MPDPPDGALVVVLVGVGVLVCVGFGVGFVDRVPSRLGADADRRGVGVGVVVFVRVGVAFGAGVVRRGGVEDGVAGMLG